MIKNTCLCGACLFFSCSFCSVLANIHINSQTYTWINAITRSIARFNEVWVCVFMCYFFCTSTCTFDYLCLGQREPGRLEQSVYQKGQRRKRARYHEKHHELQWGVVFLCCLCELVLRRGTTRAKPKTRPPARYHVFCLFAYIHNFSSQVSQYVTIDYRLANCGAAARPPPHQAAIRSVEQFQLTRQRERERRKAKGNTRSHNGRIQRAMSFHMQFKCRSIIVIILHIHLQAHMRKYTTYC